MSVRKERSVEVSRNGFETRHKDDLEAIMTEIQERYDARKKSNFTIADAETRRDEILRP